MSGRCQHTSLASLPEEPFELFTQWYEGATKASEIQYPSAMCLSTVASDGRPQGRFVIAHPRPRGTFVFLTDARSPKAQAMTHRPMAALTAYWGRPLEQQIRIEGRVEQAADAVADAIFNRRPRRSRMTPWVSCQSQPVEMEKLLHELARFEEDHADADGPSRPAHWVGYRLVPRSFEFWQARPGRLHDRILYRRRASGGWTRVRLAP